ncbi:MAG TPA: sigma-70 family RNA polymerase sigma factor [Candidatus Angelobacter sp.]|jgi:DNA-directed RNA polymerase specialized sigma24 family protein|nr:sigma-70 family RNA polymerase sigma factor [Candidatus Angelobacter sp.]
MNWRELPDRELVERCLAGDELAWREFLRRFNRLLRGVVFKTLTRKIQNPLHLVDDLVQDAFRRLTMDSCRPLRGLEWRHEKALPGLLKATASTAVLDYLRKIEAGRRDVDKEVALDTPGVDVAASAPFDREVEHKVLLQQLARCLESVLKEEEHLRRSVAMFLLYFGHKVTAMEISRVYKLDVRIVENTVARLARVARTRCIN